MQPYTRLLRLFCGVLLGACAVYSAPKPPIPPPTTDASLAAQPGRETAVFAGGCFWGVQAVFQRVKGVVATRSGYSGGSAKTATYQQVVTETTGHAESVEVTFDPSRITYGQLLRIYFSVAHDPTQLNRQGPDTGTSYRSAIFYASEEQARLAKTYIAQLDEERVFPKKIVTGDAITSLLQSGGLSSGLRLLPPRELLHSSLRSAENQRAEAAVPGFVC